MSIPSEVRKKWEGRVVDEKFPLRQWLGGSDHSAVFLTDFPGGTSKKAAIKLIAGENLNEDLQLSRWSTGAKISHPHLIRLFDGGRCVIDGTRLLYCVMEFADEDLSQILPLRPLLPEEASDMLRPAAEALGSLHGLGLAHGSIKPSNIMAAGNQLKVSADSLSKIGDRNPAHVSSAYDAPELAATGPSSAADVWSLGATLIAVLTQTEPQSKNGNRKSVPIPNTIPAPFNEIARECLGDEQHRCTAEDILSKLQSPIPVVAKPSVTSTPAAKPAIETPAVPREVKARRPQPLSTQDRSNQQTSKRWLVVTIVALALIVGVWLGIRFLSHQTPAPLIDNQAATQSQPMSGAAKHSPAPSPGNPTAEPKRGARGSVLQQFMPDVSRGAQNTITGRVKVTVQVSVDASGHVSEAKFVAPGPSKYFAARSLEAARKWKFTPPQIAGQPSPSEWLVRFEIGRGSIQAFPSQTKP